MSITRRSFLQLTLGGAVLVSAPGFAKSLTPTTPTHEATMTFTLPPLPYDKSALEPHISAKTFEFHHGKHHQAYVTKLNELVAGTEFEKKSLEEIILASAKDESKKPLFNNAAQHWNHSFFWHCLTPKNGGGKPTGEIAKKIDSDLGGYDKFAADFKAAAIAQFGSGWAWLVADKSGKLKITKTANAELPMTAGDTALLTVDVWEHAYYLDFQNRRPDFVQTCLDKLLNWEFAAANLAGEKFKVAA